VEFGFLRRTWDWFGARMWDWELEDWGGGAGDCLYVSVVRWIRTVEYVG